MDVATGRRERISLIGGLQVAMTTRADGDARPGIESGGVVPLVGRAVRHVRQVHGAGVLVVGAGEAPTEAPEADALVSARDDVALGVLSADCALVALASPEGVFGVAHAGWRGLLAGVIEASASAMRSLGASRIEAVVSPMIGPECYEFSEPDLEALVERLGPAVRAKSASGAAALDLPAGILVALEACGVEHAGRLGGCTACSGDWFSHRARKETGRQALLAWRDIPGGRAAARGPGARRSGAGGA